MTRAVFHIAVFFCTFIFSLTLRGQDHCRTNRYLNPDFFTEENIQVDFNRSYGMAIDWMNVADTQKFHIYYPKLDIDELKRRPFIMLMHGGGFKPEDDFSNKDQWNKLCLLLAKRGFVTATIDYRVGWTDRKKSWPEYTSEERKNPTGIYAVWRAYQDARAALRYFVRYSGSFGIDTNNIFIGGRSAGGDLSLATSFYSRHDVDSVLNTVIQENFYTKFGSLDSSTNNLTNKFKIRALANMWGPIFDTAMVSREEALAMPVILFHGTDDKSVTYKKWDTTDFPYIVFGSYYIAQRYKHLGACYELNTKVGGGHGEDFSNEFLADKMSSFFKGVMCGNCKSGEFESPVSVKSRLESFFSSDLLMNSLPVILLALIITLVIKFIKRRKGQKWKKTK